MSIKQHINVSVVALSQENQASPLCSSFPSCRGNGCIAKHWLTKVANFATIGLVVEQLKGSGTTCWIEPVEQETSMSECPRPKRTVRGKFDANLLTEIMHQRTSKRSDSSNCILNQGVSMAVRWRIGFPGRQTHTQPCIHHHSLKLQQGGFIVAPADKLGVSKNSSKSQ